jgi:hypothetical protein
MYPQFRRLLCAITRMLNIGIVSTLSEKLEYLFFSLGYFRAISWTLYNNIFLKYSPLYVLMSFQKYFGFFRT